MEHIHIETRHAVLHQIDLKSMLVSLIMSQQYY